MQSQGEQSHISFLDESPFCLGLSLYGNHSSTTASIKLPQRLFSPICFIAINVKYTQSLVTIFETYILLGSAAWKLISYLTLYQDFLTLLLPLQDFLLSSQFSQTLSLLVASKILMSHWASISCLINYALVLQNLSKVLIITYVWMAPHLFCRQLPFSCTVLKSPLPSKHKTKTHDL